MGVYWISRNNIAFNYISVAHHKYHSNYIICHTYHGVYRICFQWNTNVPSCPVYYYSVIIISTVNTYRGGRRWYRGGGKPSLTTGLLFLTLPVLWIDCGCWYLLLLLIHPSLRITKMIGPFCPISWKKLTDNGNWGWINIYLTKNHNENQPGDLKGQICVSRIPQSKKNTGGFEQWESVSYIHRQLIKTGSFLSIDHKFRLTFIVLPPWGESPLRPLPHEMTGKCL